uniref:Uncharacterized protein n=1 Tax=Aegilops tauschii subsp. strangulata TaxID=200361 RepID=A0A453LIT0_AEGTS
KLEGEREMTLGFVDLLRDDFIEKDRAVRTDTNFVTAHVLLTVRLV